MPQASVARAVAVSQRDDHDRAFVRERFDNGLPVGHSARQKHADAIAGCRLQRTEMLLKSGEAGCRIRPDGKTRTEGVIKQSSAAEPVPSLANWWVRTVISRRPRPRISIRLSQPAEET